MSAQEVSCYSPAFGGLEWVSPGGWRVGSSSQPPIGASGPGRLLPGRVPGFTALGGRQVRSWPDLRALRAPRHWPSGCSRRRPDSAPFCPGPGGEPCALQPPTASRGLEPCPGNFFRFPEIIPAKSPGGWGSAPAPPASAISASLEGLRWLASPFPSPCADLALARTPKASTVMLAQSA